MPQEENVGTDLKTKNYRIYEAFNDIEIVSKSITKRPNKVSATGTEVLQDFSVTYKKPFKPSGLTDISLKSMKFYNLTSAYGCYKFTPAVAAVAADEVAGTAGTDAVPEAFGIDPDALWVPAVAADAVTGTAAVPGIGCKGHW